MRQLDGITDFNGLEFEQALGGGKGQGHLACYSPWGHKESDTTEQLINNIVNYFWKEIANHKTFHLPFTFSPM